MSEQPPPEPGAKVVVKAEETKSQPAVEPQPIKQPTKQVISQAISKNGRDEMNLVEFPFALLSTRTNPDVKTIEISKQGTNRKGELVEQKWTVTGSDKFGLPTIVGEEVYIVLMALTHQDGFKSQEISFKASEALRQLGWRLDGQSYWRLRKALRVLSGVNIYAQNLFYDNKLKDYITEKKFSIIANYDWYGDEDKTIKINWDKFLWTSFKNNYIKAIDTDFYFSLSSAIAQRLYRILDKRFYRKSKVEFDLRELAFDHLTMSKKYDGGQIKRKLTPAIEELITSGYLNSYEYQPPKGRTKKVIFYKGKATRPTLEKTEPQTQAGDSSTTNLVHQLVRYGIPESVAKELTEKHPERIEMQIKYHEYRLQKHADKVAQNPPGFLRKAIEGDWTAPADYSSPEEQEQRQKQYQESQRRRETQIKIEDYQTWLNQTPEEKVKGEIWLWEHQYKKDHNGQQPTLEEKQNKEQELIQQIPTEEQKQVELFGKTFRQTEELF